MEVEVGQVWAGITGNKYVVTEIDGDRAYLKSMLDPEDGMWEERHEIAEFLRFVAYPTTERRSLPE